jgi:lipopolysaccharide export system permease protein
VRLLDRYLLVEWLKALGLALGATLTVLLLEDMYSNLGDLLADGAHGTHVLTYYRTLLPGFLPAVLPMSQLVSLLFVASNLHRNQEITAMRAAGLSLWRIARPWWVGSAVLAALLGWLDATVVPASIEQARVFREQLHRDMELKTKPAADVGLVRQLTYENLPAHRHWFINQFNTDTRHATGVSVYELDDNGNDQRYLLANEGFYDMAKGHWVLSQGREIKFDHTGSPIASFPFDKEEFFALKEDPALMLTLRQKPDALSMDEIQGALEQPSSANNGRLDSFAVQYYTFLAKPLICLLVVGLAVPLAVTGIRTSPMVGASKAVGWLFVYYLVQGTCTHLGEQHYLTPIVAAGLPIVGMLALSLWLFKREA